MKIGVEVKVSVEACVEVEKVPLPSVLPQHRGSPWRTGYHQATYLWAPLSPTDNQKNLKRK